MTKSRARNGEFLIALTFPEPWIWSLCSETQIICLHLLLPLLTCQYQPKVPGWPASYAEAICSSVTPFLLMIYGPREEPQTPAIPRVASTSCEADLMRVEHSRWRLQTHLMAVEAPNYTHLHPYLGEATPPRHLGPWQRSCRASFCSSAPVSGDLQGGWSWTSCCFSSTRQVHLLRIKMPSLYAASQILSSGKQEPEPSDTTSATTADDQQKGKLSLCEDAEDSPSFSRHMEFFFTQHKLWFVFRGQNSLLLLPRAWYYTLTCLI